MSVQPRKRRHAIKTSQILPWLNHGFFHKAGATTYSRVDSFPLSIKILSMLDGMKSATNCNYVRIVR
jgi:hypothetical protein